MIGMQLNFFFNMAKLRVKQFVPPSTPQLLIAASRRARTALSGDGQSIWPKNTPVSPKLRITTVVSPNGFTGYNQSRDIWMFR